MVLDRALVQRSVRATEVELRARLRELHAEDGALDAALCLRLVDERRAAERGDLLEGHPEDAVDRVARERARERGHRGEGLPRGLDPRDGDGVGEDGPGGRRAVAVLDGERARLRRGRGRVRGVVLVLPAARGLCAVLRRHPQIGGAG